jgi:hypothetical protein
MLLSFSVDTLGESVSANRYPSLLDQASEKWLKKSELNAMDPRFLQSGEFSDETPLSEVKVSFHVKVAPPGSRNVGSVSSAMKKKLLYIR